MNLFPRLRTGFYKKKRKGKSVHLSCCDDIHVLETCLFFNVILFVSKNSNSYNTIQK